VVAGLTDPDRGVWTRTRPRSTVFSSDCARCRRYLLGDSGPLGLHERRPQHAFERFYYPCLTHAWATGSGLYLPHEGTEGAQRASSSSRLGLGWVRRLSMCG